jgi:GAF domain-containing protein/HAMP domain-containing protein
MFDNPFFIREKISKNQQTPILIDERQKRIGLWAAAIFSVLGMAFLIFWSYNVVFLQKGQADFSDLSLLPVTILMLLAGLGSFLLIRRNRLILGLWLVYLAVLIPPLMAVLVLGNVYIIAIAYLAVFAPISIVWMFPKSSRWAAIIATAVVLLAIIGIEAWNPAFRMTSTALVNFAPYAIALGGLSLLAIFTRQVFVGNIFTKLIVSFVVIAVFSVGIAAFSAQRSLSTSLTESIGNNLSELSTARAVEIAMAIDHEKNILEVLSLNKVVQAAALEASSAAPLSQADITRLDEQWRTADAAGNNADPLVASVINNQTASELQGFQKHFPQHVEVFLTNTQGLSIASTNRTSDYLQADEEWWQVAYKDGSFIGQPEYDSSSKMIAIIMAVTIRENGEGRVLGVLRTTVNFTTLTDTLSLGLFGKTGRTNIYLPSGQELKLNVKADSTAELVQMVSPVTAQMIISKEKYQEFSLNGIPVLASTALVQTIGGSSAIATLNWHVVVIQDKAEALLPVNVQTRNIIILAAIIIIAVAFAALGLARVISGPIIRLNTFASQVAAGDLTVHAKVETRDEIGTLATTFNSMVTQMRDLIGSLEKRVAERTQSLELAAEVGRSISHVRNLDVMLKDAAELIRSRFDLYYVQVYLTNPAQNLLLLQAGTGTVGTELVGRGHHLPLDTTSINGRAAVEKRSVVISDTNASETSQNLLLFSYSKQVDQVISDTAASEIFRSNPLLPDTRSEMAIPLMVGEKVVGVLDLQNNKEDSLNQDILPGFEALAGQLAIAIQNANLLAETNQARAEVEAQARRLTRANWVDYLDAIHQPEETGFVFEQNKITPMTQTEQTQTAENSNTLVAPIAVTGEALGNLVVEMEGQSPIARTDELVNTVARQVSQQIESLRLLDSAERYRAEAEQASHRLTREGWIDYKELNAGEGMSYIYDLKEVRPFNQARDQQAEESALSLPVKVRDETVGKLVVQGLGSDDNEVLDLVNAVAERLGAHIESLRQFDQTQSALAQTEKLSVASLRFAQSANLQELLTITHETLDIPVVNRMLLGVFNYSSANELESMDIVANWWNGSGHEPSEIGRHYTIETLNVLPLFMSPTPVFSNDTFHDERVNGAALELVTRQNIHSMAVLPLYLGGRQIGVLFLESEETHNFTQSDTRLFTAMAPQIATVLENRRQFERAQKQAERESTLNIISQKIQSATTVEAVLQIAARELGHALGAPMTIAQLSMKDKK